MMNVLHCSAECFPYAKIGGLADVAGALPKFQQKQGINARLVMPMHRTSFLYENEWEVIYKHHIVFRSATLDYTIIREKKQLCGFDLFAIDIHGLLDREKVYGYYDDAVRYLAFQVAVVDWLCSWNNKPDVVHVHDHHAALIPFLMHHTKAAEPLHGIKTVFTIHNAQYQGNMSWDMSDFFPAWDTWKTGLLEWNGQINSLACGIKCADKVNTVSKQYMEDLRNQANGLERLFEFEKGKCTGIVNGIDYEVWDPENDHFIPFHFNQTTLDEGKKNNKVALCQQFGLDASLPLFIFIGRLVEDKGVDLIPSVIEQVVNHSQYAMNCLMLGSGSYQFEQDLQGLANRFPGQVRMVTAYNEPLSHKMYASADFLLMPSRVEPCGLNQLYALRYGTIPIVRRTGGLQDTVTDIGEEGGFGICFQQANESDLFQAMNRALELYNQTANFKDCRARLMKINHSWEQSAKEYTELYQSI